MARAPLSSPKAVIDALGGVDRVAQLTGRKYKTAWNWTTWSHFPANTYIVLTLALAQQRLTAPASLWRMNGTGK